MPIASPSSTPNLARWLLIVGGCSLAFRLWLAHALPITGDEAFFYWWGVRPDWGYSDHPPMVGWAIALARWALGDSTWAVRLPAVLLPLGVGAALWWAFKPQGRTQAAWAVLLFWLTPLSWLNVLVTTDTPLIFWSVLSVALLVRAEQRTQLDAQAWRLYALSGLFLGCAFLSKYFSVVLGLGYLLYFGLYRRPRWPALAVLVLCALPGPLINIAWNMGHGWPNIMFNVYNRNQDAAFAWRQPLLYLGMLVYLITPALGWQAWRHRTALRAMARQQRLLATLLVVPLLFFGVLSLKKVVGLHWVLSFYPLLFVLMAMAWPTQVLRRAAWGLAAFTGLHLLVVAGLSLTHLEQWQGKPRYFHLVRSFKTAELLAQVTRPGTVLMADGYSPAAVYGYTLGQYVPVFGPGKFHSRQDDQWVDFSVYQGQTVRVLLSDAPQMADFTPYFDSVRPFTVVQDGMTFHAVEGVNFNFEAYRRGVLADIHQRYYDIPQWLPMTGCPFCVRYCGQVRCPR